MAMATTISRQVWLLALLVGMEIANPLLAMETLGARILSTVLFVGVAAAVLSAVLRTRRQRYLGATLVGAAIALEIARNAVTVSGERA